MCALGPPRCSASPPPPGGSQRGHMGVGSAKCGVRGGKYRSSVDTREPQNPTKSEEHKRRPQGETSGGWRGLEGVGGGWMLTHHLVDNARTSGDHLPPPPPKGQQGGK
eukprot:982835-Prorocentrum_minimum.AAC.1